MDLHIEDSNKIRVAMGLKPLPVPGAAPSNAGPVFKDPKQDDDSDDEPASTLETRTAESYDNWMRLQKEADAKAKRDAQKAAIKKARDQALRFRQLEGKGLADEGEDVDTKTWLLQSKKRQKKIEKARKLEEEMAEREREAQAAVAYTAADLKGVKVGHELDEFVDGEEQILVLKDADIIGNDDGEDELEAITLKEKENLKQKLDSKKRKRVYDPNDDEEGQKSILAQYDEEIEGKKRKVFTLDGQGRTVEEAEMAEKESTKSKKGMTFSLDLLKDDNPISDYMDISNIKVRKPKKKSKSTRKKAIENDDIFPVPEVTPPKPIIEEGAMDVDTSKPAPARPRKTVFDQSFVDDDDLQAKIAMQRRQALKNRKKMRPEDLARQLREEDSASPDVMQTTEDADEEPGLVLDETTEFVANLQQKPAERERRKSSQPANDARSMAGSPAADNGDIEMAQSYNEVEDEDERMERPTRSVSADVTTTGLEEEESLTKGLGGALAMLRKRGILKEPASDLNAFYRDRQRFLAEKAKAESSAEIMARQQRERDRNSGKLDQMTPREREDMARKNNNLRDVIEARKTAELFSKEYRPNVTLNYVDEHGRQMNQKEAFKQLSHQFHGKGSGKQKTEKHLAKIEAEKRKLAAPTLDSSQTGMSNAQGVQAKKHRQAGVRLQ
ncbi:DNA binding protein SART-1 [Lepidopterella palustris CBS 459.81]|uniref:DNA binding protein SART-1 n=1 Tax=Lepidopterella palustris CBS 459.81 TaxID=1314670 RepID=A0A8E2JAM8_9PEZI|nr:DNA binding protein SART-1 [Lepidopterella palustris CBS 459.81]